MSLMITKDCISCEACLEECPEGAIYEDEPTFMIDADRCTECISDATEPACIMVCPVECIKPDPDNVESPEELRFKHEMLSKGE